MRAVSFILLCQMDVVTLNAAASCECLAFLDCMRLLSAYSCEKPNKRSIICTEQIIQIRTAPDAGGHLRKFDYVCNKLNCDPRGHLPFCRRIDIVGLNSRFR